MTKAQAKVIDAMKANPNARLIVGNGVHVTEIVSLEEGKSWLEARNKWTHQFDSGWPVFRALSQMGLITEEASTLGYSVYKLA